MGGFAGFYQKGSLLSHSDFHYNNLSKMIQTQKHRRDSDSHDNLILTSSFAFASTKGIRTLRMYDKTYHLLFCGELYNTSELRCMLGTIPFSDTNTDYTELILHTFISYGEEAFLLIKGSFSFALIIEEEHVLYLVRDALGCKPAYYSTANGFLFATEPKALLAHPDVDSVVDPTGLQELLFLGPAHTPGITVFRDIKEVKPGHFIKVTTDCVTEKCYWSLKTAPHTDSYQETVEKTTFLVQNAVLEQAHPYSQIACLLSGGIDSSIVTAICAKELAKHNLQLKTYSFDYEENDTYFQSNSFQPSLDRPYVDKMVSDFHTDHKYLSCTQKELFDTLTQSLKAHDIPPMGDIDASLLYFCQKIAPECSIVLTGECADEVFGGYPWFHREDLLSLNTFPWSANLSPRTAFLKDSVCNYYDANKYVNRAFTNATSQITYLPEESDIDRIKRRNGFISLSWFGATLLNRMERCSASAGLMGRIPFADRDLVEYIYNVPWNMKIRDGVIKSLLREAFHNNLPEEILYRKKSPYPKTYHPAYEELLRTKLLSRLSDPSCPLHSFVDAGKLKTYIMAPKSYTTPWYGQLMAGPQMLAYLLQIDYWMIQYNVKLEIM